MSVIRQGYPDRTPGGKCRTRSERWSSTSATLPNRGSDTSLPSSRTPGDRSRVSGGRACHQRRERRREADDRHFGVQISPISREGSQKDSK